MNTALVDTKKQTRISAAYKAIVDRWTDLPADCSEPDLATQFMPLMFEKLGIKMDGLKTTPSIGSGLKPDYLIYQDSTESPVLVVEIKKRVASLASIPDKEFAEQCYQNNLYQLAVGFDSSTSNNGIRQYMEVGKVNEEHLAPYGLVFNGDFFQLWRRIGGLVFPLTPIQKVTKTSLPKLLKQLQKCLSDHPPALVVGVWNMKGGVAKTTNTINVASTLALQGKSVLLIDLDPQGDLTHGLGYNPEHLPDFLTPVAAKLDLKESDAAQAILKSAIQQTSFPTSEKQSFSLSLLATHKKALEDFRDNAEVNPVKPFIGMIELLKREYDYIFIDASPALDKLAQSLLYTCDQILVPIDGGKAIRHAIRIHQELLPKIRQSRLDNHLSHGPLSLGVVRSNWTIAQDSKVEKALSIEIAQQISATQYETRLKQYEQTEMAHLKQKPVACWRNSPISKLYDDLTQEVFVKHNFISQ
jgi:chromosome partitioning protein